MRKTTRLGVALAALLLPLPLSAAVPCGTGTLDFTHGSDTPQTGTLFNVGQKVILTAQAVGVAPSLYTWTVAGPGLRDYNERIGSTSTSSAVIPWSTTPLPPTLTGASISFYWKPSPTTQVHPSNGGPVNRQVTLVATLSGGGTCTVVRTFSVERNATDATKQAVDFYTSTHRAAGEPNAQKGVVIDDHAEWHSVPATQLLPFLPWHREFIARFDHWLAEFGYPAVEPWDPGTPIPVGPDIDHAVRQTTYAPAANRIPTWFTMAGGAPAASGGQKRLFAYTSLMSFSDDFEYNWHPTPHCNVGPFNNFGPDIFASMCYFSSPKDPLFFRWHKFVDHVYANYCGVRSLTCAPGPAPASDAWIGDNAADIAANGATPSPAPHYISPDVWNRTSSAACTPVVNRPGRPTDPPRDCGSGADHENPVAGVTNFLYATLRNDRPGAAMVGYVEVAIYVANASSGLAWPTDFGGAPAGIPLPETRQFITLNLQPGQSVDIGPLPWTPPNPSPSDHWCAYIRVLSVQAPLGLTETASVDANTGGSNSIAWKNLKIVTVGPPVPPGSGGVGAQGADRAAFIVRNTATRTAQVELAIELPERFARAGAVQVDLGRLAARWVQAGARGEGIRRRGDSLWVTGRRAVIAGIPMQPREAQGITMRFQSAERMGRDEDVLVTQRVNGVMAGGMQFRLRDARPGGGRADSLADLRVSVQGPAEARAGEDLSARVRLAGSNAGGAPADGTAEGGSAGYMIDLVLSPDSALAVRPATFSPTYQPGVLLRGGRVSNTRRLAPGATAEYPVGAVIPADTPPGRYCLGAVIDPLERVGEASERNNTACHWIRVLPPR
jgi:hypothetical protein